MGSQIAHADLVTSMAIRMKVEDWLHRHPELLERPIEKPMFVFGLPRSGTTLMINLLHADPARRSFLRWEAYDPVPPPKSGGEGAFVEHRARGTEQPLAPPGRG